MGCEGFTGIEVALGGDRSLNEVFIQVAGRGWQLSADHLRAGMDESRSLERALLGFARRFLEQATRTMSACMIYCGGEAPR